MPIDIETTYKTRKPLFKQIHDFRFYYTRRNIEIVGENFIIFIERILGEKCPLPNDFTYFGCITNESNPQEIEKETALNAIEIRADSYHSIERSYKAIGSIKELIPGIQIIYTLRCNDINDQYWKTIKSSLKWIPDFLDVQFSFNSGWTENFTTLRKKAKNTRIILSYHSEQLNENLENCYNKMKLLNPDILKFISPLPILDNSFREISFEMSREGIISRVQNTFFSPVKVDVALASGQLTYQELSHFQVAFNIKPSNLFFYLAGNNIKKSPGPNLYNSLFKEYGLDYKYKLLETSNITEVIQTLRDKSCIGMSITIPFKEEIMEILDEISPEAKNIGSVNTIIKYKNRLIGYNTD